MGKTIWISANRSPAAPFFGVDAVALHAQLGAAGGAGRNAQGHGPTRRGQIDLGAADGLAQRDGHADQQVVAAALEVGVRGDVDGDEDIAGRAAARGRLALAADANLLAVLDAGGNLHRQRLGLARGPLRRRSAPLRR